MTRRFQRLLLVSLLSWAGAVRAQPVTEECGDGIVRFFASEEARASCLPSLALIRELPVTGPAPAAFPVRPVFQKINHRDAVVIHIDPGTSLYGTGEVPGPLPRNGRRTTAWNFDAYGYGDGTPHLYQSHPWVLAVRRDGSSYGVLADTSHRCHIDTSWEIVISADGPAFPVIVIERDSPQEVVRTLADLTGHMPMPPKWALGYHQCRYSYYPDSRVREIASEFRKRRIPCDVIWLDIDYMDGFRSFTFSPHHFPDPKRLLDHLHAQRFHTIAIIDPGIKKEPGYFVYDSGTAIDAWVKTSEGTVYTGSVWPGNCVFPDFTRARVRSWWSRLFPDFLARGIDGIWNDMNEPAIFHVASKTMPLSNVHMADDALGGAGTHARYHNVYGMLMARASREGARLARPDKRPFVLTRAGFAGGQRYAACWTGDNTASWYHLDISIPMVLNLGLSGQPFAGPDIGGFKGAGDAQMFARWMGIGALLPFARGHTGKGNIDKEPWAFGRKVEATCTQALQRRYRLMPYLYTLFREASRTGLPVARPVFFADPTDPALRAEDDAFLLGSDLLVVATVTPRRAREAAMPRGTWRRFDLGLGGGANPALPDLYLRGGSIVPVGPVMQSVDAVPLDPLELLICLDENGRAEGVLYEDAGDGWGYLDGEYRLTRYEARRENDRVDVTGQVEEGEWPRAARQITVRLLMQNREIEARGPSTGPVRIRIDGDGR
ncbi:MAG: TIM-barrel domain-containing protein [Candidatus Krumholzibacteriia bacterium]